mmetsp:Transcript_35352/g.77317  ORF Transcript_35352/g.77317 Transcript_35352/m.77317 type:complete len:193 (+) Transcript_35352:62-640(+)
MAGLLRHLGSIIKEAEVRNASATLKCSGLPLGVPMGARWKGKISYFSFPPEIVTRQYTGYHCHPGMWKGYKNPQKRQGKEKKLPNVKLRSSDFHLGPAANGDFGWRVPYPPRVNRTIPVCPLGKRNPWPTQEHKSYPLRWRNIEYTYEPRLTRKPHGTADQRWTGPVTRIEHVGQGKTVTELVTHDARLLDW